jgi:hypothetical protein
LVKVSSNGSFQWRRSISSDTLFNAEGLVQAADGGHVLSLSNQGSIMTAPLVVRIKLLRIGF